MTEHTADEKMVVAEEALIADTQVAIHTLLETKQMSRADLARALGVSEARVSQFFRDDPTNLTLRTLARIFHVLGEEARLTSQTLDRLNPPRDIEAAEFQAVAVKKKPTPTLIRHREAARARVEFTFEANDNIVEREGDLAAA